MFLNLERLMLTVKGKPCSIIALSMDIPNADTLIRYTYRIYPVTLYILVGKESPTKTTSEIIAAFKTDYRFQGAY